MNILLIQNDTREAKKIMVMVAQWGYEIILASSLGEISMLLRENRLELILLDLSYPPSQLVKIISDIKHIQPEIKLITMTATNSPQLEKMIRELGIVYYLIKPVLPNELQTILIHISRQYSQSNNG